MGQRKFSALSNAYPSGAVVHQVVANHKTAPSVPLTPQRLELIKAYAKLSSSSIEVSNPAEGFFRTTIAAFLHRLSAIHMPRLRGASRSIGPFVTVLLMAVLPSLALVAIIWLGMTNGPSSGPVKANARQSPATVQLVSSSPVLSTPRRLEAAAGDTVPFPIALDGTDAVPARSLIAIRGLPIGSTFSSGRPYGQTEWTLRTDEIGELHLTLPEASTRDAVTIELIAPDGRVLTNSATLLEVTANSEASIIVRTVTTQRIDGDVANSR
jgi:hypothetical protein